ncbi:hypothetical protein EV193_11613 [Herbihabitans rhizosphaerae]|uniref:Uncharacterized protein n=1 Tax=Herbihabitans rhizosphaerae TaxID=1872711 RepID=A0A4Q7KCQ0_9PSEU|nr:hypothetical protein EV193_11613 [Herbihabitans rhizosphaerae]
MMCDWVSTLKYISVFLHTSRSSLDMGASRVMSCLPKITRRRRSVRKLNCRPLGSKYLARIASGTASMARVE